MGVLATRRRYARRRRFPAARRIACIHPEDAASDPDVSRNRAGAGDRSLSRPLREALRLRLADALAEATALSPRHVAACVRHLDHPNAVALPADRHLARRPPPDPV